MDLNKYPTPANFIYPEDFQALKKGNTLRLKRPGGEISYTLLGDQLVCIRSTLARTEKINRSQTELNTVRSGGIKTEKSDGCFILHHDDLNLQVDPATGSFQIDQQDRMIAKSAIAPFGVCGSKSICLLDRPAPDVVYGLGEKTGGLDKSFHSYKMWNLDVVNDFPYSFMKDDFDPSYVSIPFFITKSGGDYFGIYVHNPGATFFHTGIDPKVNYMIPPARSRKDGESVLAFGCEEGLFEFYILPGPTLRDVVKRFARLTGRHELPPHWSLGYHQCRWGYKSAKEIADISRRLAEAKIPVSALWLDIDHMEGYRCFTYNKKNFSKTQRERYFKQVHKRGTRLVTIIDPGLKPDYNVYKKGLEQDIFCKTPEGEPFKGIVWPGEAVFPDFSLPEAREFWAGWVKKHLATGLSGIWNDMNDPSCGAAGLDDMLFDRGKAPHWTCHNQYGHLMAQATHEGFRKHDPNQRPFILTRSASTGTQKYAAVWTGDNASNETHLAMSIPMSINLALSGVSFNGPDVGGFAFDTTEDLMVAWMKAGALFPFFRNHSTIHTRNQEPDAFSKKALGTIRNCINTRAKLLPYLYNQFYLHTRDGEAVMRPMSYEFKGKTFERIEDQYLIGSSVMVAPFVNLSDKTREVILPRGWWYNMIDGRWIQGGRKVQVKQGNWMNLFIRDGAILPCIEGTTFMPQPDFSKVAFHIFVREKTGTEEYYEDNGLTRDYQNGQYNLLQIKTKLQKGMIAIDAEFSHQGMPKNNNRWKCYFYGKAPAEAKDCQVRWPFGTYKAAQSFLKI